MRRVGLAALLSALLWASPAKAQDDLSELKDVIELTNGTRVEGLLQGVLPIPDGDPVRIRVEKDGKVDVFTYPPDVVDSVRYRGDAQLERATALYQQGEVEKAYEALRQLELEVPGWRPELPLRLTVGLAWGRLLSQSGREDQAAVVYRETRKFFPEDADLKARAEAALEKVAEDSYSKRDYQAFRRMLTEMRGIAEDSKVAARLQERFDEAFRALVAEAQAAQKAEDERTAVEKAEEAFRMKPEHPDARALVKALRGTYQRFHYGEPTRILGFDPVTCRSPAERRLQQFLYSGLVRHILDPRALVETSYSLDLARNVRLSPDGRRIVIDLRPDLKWSDGAPVTAEDVLATLQAMVSEASAERDAVLARLLDAGSSRRRGAQGLLLALEFSTPRPRMILDFPILPASRLGDPPVVTRGGPLSLEPIGTGPFKLEKREGNAIILVANEHFRAPGAEAAAPPTLAEVRVTSFADPTTARTRLENDQIDLLTSLHPADVLRLEANGRTRVEHLPTNEVTFLAFNHRRDALQGRPGFYLRKGINLAINKEKLLVEHYQARRGVRSAHRILTGPFPRGSWAYNEEVAGYEHDAGLARQAFRQSRLKDLTLRFIHPPDPIITAICSVMKKEIQDAGADIGLRVRLVKLTPALFRTAIEKRAFDMAWCDFTFDRPILDLEPLLADQETGPEGRNYMGYRDPELARLFDTLRLTDLWTRIQALNQEVHRHLHENAVIVPLWQLDSYFAVSQRVEDLELHPVHLFGAPWALKMR